MEKAEYQRPHLDFVDGLRGICAIQVLLIHAKYFFFIPSIVQTLALPSYPVAAFITISGFVLYIPSAGEDAVIMKRSVFEYIKRRAIRLLPPWYAGLLLSCLLFSLMACLGLSRGATFSEIWDSLIWHATFLHSWNTEHRFSLNSALWFMGFELQLSLCFPLFLILVRRWGWITLFALGIALTLPLSTYWSEFCRFLFSPALTLPFILGMFAARLARRPDLFFKGFNERTITFILLALLLASIGLHQWCLANERGALASCTAALGVAPLLVYLTYFSRSPMQRFLSHPTLVFLGSFSYSLFLIHEPLLSLMDVLTMELALSPLSRFYLVFLPTLLLILALSYLFHRCFERPSLKMARRAKTNKSLPAL